MQIEKPHPHFGGFKKNSTQIYIKIFNKFYACTSLSLPSLCTCTKYTFVGGFFLIKLHTCEINYKIVFFFSRVPTFMHQLQLCCEKLNKKVNFSTHKKFFK